MALLDHAPQFTANDAQTFAQDLYGLKAQTALLPSERDQNFLLTAAEGSRYVLKIANALEDYALLEAQNQVLQHLADYELPCPRVLVSRRGHSIEVVAMPEGPRHWLRVVSYLPGLPWGRIKRHTPALLENLGQALGQLDAAFATFDHPALRRDFHWDLAKGPEIVQAKADLIADEELRGLVNSLANGFAQNVAPLLPALRRSVIHNDANDYNLLVTSDGDLFPRHQRISGLIDFGDMVYSHTVNDLAIAIAYAALDKDDPSAVASRIVKGYHAAYPLTENELAALFGLVCLRLCQSACIAAEQQAAQPDNEYLTISQEPIRRTLPRLASIHPRRAEAAFRLACGLEALPQGERVTSWLRANQANFAPVLPDLHTASLMVFDLSVGSPLISSDEQQNTEPEVTKRLNAALQAAGAEIGVGRYDEPRLLYNSPLFTAQGEARTIHLGLDLFAPVGTPVRAPLDGTVYAFAYNAAPLDYGHVVILQHQTSDGDPFFTLYGHLSAESFKGWHTGRQIKAGEQFAMLGGPAENGGWTPHLHLQLILDPLSLDCAFPGVARPSERELWRALSPDPNLLLGLPRDIFPPSAPAYAATLKQRRRVIGGSVRTSYVEPVKIARGWMQYLYDEDGRRYLDAYNNVPHVGHCHPRIVAAACGQMSVLNTNTRYLGDLLNTYSEKLCATLPEPLSVCYFVNSASEANELALRLARAYTNRRDVIVLEAAYHGHTTTLVDISPYKHDGPGGEGAPAWVHTAPLPDLYRGRYRREDPDAAAKYAAHVAEIVAQLKENNTGPACFIAESLPSVGGQIMLPKGYLAAVYETVRAAGGVCIADDVQTGYGRIGTHFWGFEQQEVAPDIVVLGKPIGNGHPLGAVITTPAIATAFDNGMEFFSTFGGNTVSCAVGLAVLEVVQKENLQARARLVGEHLLAGLRGLAERFPVIGDVRGSGLFLGAELVTDRLTRTPDSLAASFIVNQMRDLGVLLGTDGPDHNVLKIRPPMPFGLADADYLLATLEEVLAADFGN
jgi:4-aminobutyrate aminotransferase-like enzyme/Ser/Thr protein kinase RdoA (MazF antagonist)